MRVLRLALPFFALAALPRPAIAQGYLALQVDGGAGVTYVGGNAVAGAGDTNGDGVPDIVVGAPNAFDGFSRARIYSGATGAVLQLFTSAVQNEYFGWSVSSAGDVDGDGLGDVVVGALQSSAGGVTGAGRATAFSGATGAPLWFRDGTLAFDFLGQALARVGDLDGDGVDDTAVGVLYGDNGGAFDAGRVEVLSGVTGVPFLVVNGAAIGERLGFSVAGVGDVSGDGFPDILAGAPGADPLFVTNAGTAYLLSGTNGGILFVFPGAGAQDEFGTAVAGVGDTDGDGVADLLIGATETGGSPVGNGYASLFSGATGILRFTSSGVGFAEKFGASLAGAGDLNGDAVPDLLVGAPAATAPGAILGAGRVRALSGVNGATLYDGYGGAQSAQFGIALAGTGDVDGNGVGDFVAGEPGMFATAGFVRVCSGVNGANLLTFQGQGTGDRFGTAAAPAGDVDGDGREDVVVGAPYATAAGLIQAGTASVHSGATGATLLSISGPSASASLGAAVAGLGDVNGDSIPDLAVGAPNENFTNGRVRIVSGANGATLLVLDGANGGDAFGTAVAGPGDLDGDGVPDLVVGVPQPSGLSSGFARAFSGANGAILATYVGTGQGARTGQAVAGIGDARGDGVPDVAIGSPEPGAPPFVSSGEGNVRVFSGATGGLMYQLDGTLNGSGFGASVAGTGDLNGDGLGDLVAGAPGLTLPGIPLPVGAAGVFSGANGAPLYTSVGTVSGERLGVTVGGGRDFDGDGVPEFVLGAVESGAPGPGTVGVARVFSGATGSLRFAISGTAQGDGAGLVGSPMADASGDGVPDLLFTSPLADPAGRVDAGLVRIYSLVGLPAGTSAFGAGCAGTGGFVPAIATFGGAPAPGNGNFGVSIARGRGAAPAVLFFSPFPDPVGLPFLGCTLHLAAPIFIVPVAVALAGTAGAGGAGYRLFGLGVPPDPTLSGAAVHLQWAIPDPGSASGLLSATGGMTVVIP